MIYKREYLHVIVLFNLFKCDADYFMKFLL